MARTVTAGELFDLLKADGYEELRQKGSHRQFSKGENSTTVTLPISNEGDSVPIGTAKSVAKQAGETVSQALENILGGKYSPKQQIKLMKKRASP
ncbi:MAG: hypothetical protein CO093_03025 [Alphaproteobacteria bacterium CG_4_9_14_3_um_filter_47_13]|nr:MAG: hypothetical protein CO093_03025 [Alphaproteobacteria bacterium CG_4_9_14_3_um_filter_47_13]